MFDGYKRGTVLPVFFVQPALADLDHFGRIGWAHDGSTSEQHLLRSGFDAEVCVYLTKVLKSQAPCFVPDKFGWRRAICSGFRTPINVSSLSRHSFHGEKVFINPGSRSLSIEMWHSIRTRSLFIGSSCFHDCVCLGEKTQSSSRARRPQQHLWWNRTPPRRFVHTKELWFVDFFSFLLFVYSNLSFSQFISSSGGEKLSLNFSSEENKNIQFVYPEVKNLIDWLEGRFLYAPEWIQICNQLPPVRVVRLG